MTSSTIEKTVLSLPKSDRAHLANLLLGSLDEPSDSEVQQRWIETSQRRATEIDSGKVTLVSSEALEAQVQAIFR